MTIKTTNLEPYNDKFDAQKDYYRLLFRPGFAVQSRELIELQSMLQNQIGGAASSLFEDGTCVIPGGLSTFNNFGFVKLQDTHSGAAVRDYLTDFNQLIVTDDDTGVTARVVLTTEDEGAVDNKAKPALFITYLATGTNGETTFAPGDVLTAYAANNTVALNPRLSEDLAADISVSVAALGDEGQAPTQYTNNESSDVVGNCVLAFIKEGIYWTRGTFVRVSDGARAVVPFGTSGTYRVGLALNETYVTSEDDSTLLDPANGTSNYAAPGANRFKYTPVLTSLPEASFAKDDVEFVELMRYESGNAMRSYKTIDVVETNSRLADIVLDMNRTFESVKFRISKKDHAEVYPAEPAELVEGRIYADPNKIVIKVDSGRGYVNGYSIDQENSVSISLDRARNNETPQAASYVDPGIEPFDNPYCPGVASDVGGAELDHEIQVAGDGTGGTIDKRAIVTTTLGDYILITDVIGLPDEFEQVNLVSDYDADGTYGAGTVVGTARVAYIELHSDDYSGTPVFKLGLFDIDMNPGSPISSTVLGVRGPTSGFGANTASATTLSGVSSNASNASTVTGSGTAYTSQVEVGDAIIIGGTFIGYVQTVNSDILITLTASGPASAQTGIATVPTLILSKNPSLGLIDTGFKFVKTLRGADTNGDEIERNTESVVRRRFTATAAGGVISFTLTAVGEIFVNDDVISNYILFNNITGLPVDIDAADIAFNDPNDRTTITISGLADGTEYTLVGAVIQQGEVPGSERTKTLVEDVSEDFTSVAADEFALSVPDIYRLVDVRVTPGGAAYDPARYISIKDRYDLDNGQRVTHYQAGRIVAKDGQPRPEGAIRVIYDYFVHSGTGNHFSVDSYESLDIVPEFEGESLTRYLDFRPVLGDISNTYTVPVINSVLKFNLTYVGGRVDKIVLGPTGNVYALKGIPARNPVAPADPIVGLVLAEIELEPYTSTIDDVSIKQRNNRAYDPYEIGKMDERLIALENKVEISELESRAFDMPLVNAATGRPRFKTGVGVEPGPVRPFVKADPVMLTESITDPSDRLASYAIGDGNITLPWIPESYVTTQGGNKFVPIINGDTNKFNGSIKLTPGVDTWFDDESNDKEWGYWEQEWFGSDSIKSENSFRNRGKFAKGEVQNGIAQKVLIEGIGLQPTSLVNAFLDEKDIGSEVAPANRLRVSLATGQTYMQFDKDALEPNNVQDEPGRRIDTVKTATAFSRGDVLYNEAQLATTLTGMAQPSLSDTDFTLTVADASGIAVGHHVVIYDLAGHTSTKIGHNTIPASTVSTSPYVNAAELQLIEFRVTNVAGTTLTLEKLDGSEFGTISAYISGGSLQRLTASAVVGKESTVMDSDSEGNPIDQYIYIVNEIGGIAVGDTLTGTVLNENSAYNTVDVDEYEDRSTPQVDTDGVFVGVHDLDNIQSGSLTYRLIDTYIEDLADADSRAAGSFKVVPFIQRVERSIVATRPVDGIRVADRLYQTFYVDKANGMSVASIDLWFSGPNTSKVTIALTSANLNQDENTKIIPGSIAEVQNVNTDGPTTFRFPSPVHLIGGETYGVVVFTDDSNLEIEICESGKLDSLGNLISGNQKLRKLYLAQNRYFDDFRRDAYVRMDMKIARYTLNTAEIILKHAGVPIIETDGEWVSLVNGSTIVTVSAPGHGLLATEAVSISNVPVGDVYGDLGDNASGLPGYLLNGDFTVLASNLTTDTFEIDLGTLQLPWDENDLVTGKYGFAGVRITRQLTANAIYLAAADILHDGTDIRFEIDISSATVDRPGYVSIDQFNTYLLPNQRIVRTEVNKTAECILLKTTLYSEDEYVSPRLDLNATRLMLIRNIDDTRVYETPEIELLLPSTGFALSFASIVPDSGDINLYYSIDGDDYVAIDYEPKKSNVVLNRHVEVNVGGEFNTLKIKAEIVINDPIDVPVITDGMVVTYV